MLTLDFAVRRGGFTLEVEAALPPRGVTGVFGRSGAGKSTLIDAIATTLGTSSTVTQDAFMTAIRVRSAEARARKLLNERVRKAMADRKAANPQ